MGKPIIGIVGKTTDNKLQYDIWHRIDIIDEIRYLVVENGGIPICILPTDRTMNFNDNDICDPKELTEEEKNDLYEVIPKCDGIILQGGIASCKYEIEIAKKAIELDIPVFGICAGFNNILRALGTEVILDETKSHDKYDVNFRHKVNIQKDTELYNLVQEESIEVNSIHSMIAPKEKVEPFATISSYSEDGLVESIEVKNKRFVMGVKWHPELMLDTKTTKMIFSKFIEECKNYRSEK
ncbi:MAG: hypothetical protein E7310_06115 [Clostridiales bacterium]|nr:hypothetical protein [Clostridiales bacterium]